jgi:hypothetical protein
MRRGKGRGVRREEGEQREERGGGRAVEKGKRRRGETIRERGVGELGNPDVFSN